MENRFNQLAQEFTDLATADYRIDHAEAFRIVSEILQSNSKTMQLIQSAESFEKLKRTRTYKDLKTEVKRRIYYHLRQYKTDGDQLTQQIAHLQEAILPQEIEKRIAEIAHSHASTRERASSIDDFNLYLLKYVSNASTILDLGCGLFPLLFPFQHCPHLIRYVAVDRDPTCISAVQYCDKVRHLNLITTLTWDIVTGWNSLRELTGIEHYDVCLMLKLIPVIERQSREQLKNLAAVPAKSLIISGSRQALAKRRSIERRERAVLLRFAETAHRPILAELAVGEELILVLGERG